MGVLACDRAGCANVMCDRFSPVYGYICWECFNELEKLGPTYIGCFMESRKSNVPIEDQEAWSEHLKSIFVVRE